MESKNDQNHENKTIICGVPVGDGGPSTDTASPSLFQDDDVESYWAASSSF